MNQTLNGFVHDWNKTHKYLNFSLNEAPVTDRPINVEIRYPAVKYKDVFSTETWYQLNDIVDAKSHGTMFIVTDEHLFEKGIIEAKIASLNHNYEDQRIASALTWIGEELFSE
ncbi:hypothetical protein J6X04_00435 [Candidatus Saccharibacteria bacterium]|nr:hypothetical protein [Candidatus Saccharibacteria bacterium]